MSYDWLQHGWTSVQADAEADGQRLEERIRFLEKEASFAVCKYAQILIFTTSTAAESPLGTVLQRAAAVDHGWADDMALPVLPKSYVFRLDAVIIGTLSL